MLMLLKFAPWNEEASAGAEASGFGI